MNNLNKSVKKSKSIPPKKQDIIRNELKKFREIKENINLMNHSNILNKKQSIAPNKNYHNKFQQNYQNLTNLLSPDTIKDLSRIKNDSFLNTLNTEETVINKPQKISSNPREDPKKIKQYYENELRKKDILIDEYRKEISLYKKLIETQVKENEILKRELYQQQQSYEMCKNTESNISNPLILITNE